MDKLNKILHINVNANKCPQIKVNVFDTECEALLDSAAAISIVSDLSILEKHQFIMKPTGLRIRTADETEHQAVNMVHIPYTCEGKTKIIPTLYKSQKN